MAGVSRVIRFSIDGSVDRILLDCDFDACVLLPLNRIPTYRQEYVFGGVWKYSLHRGPIQALALRYMLMGCAKRGIGLDFVGDAKHELAELSSRVNVPHTVGLGNRHGRSVAIVTAPAIPLYMDMLRALQASPYGENQWSVPVGRIRDLLVWNDTQLPVSARLRVSSELMDAVVAPLPEPFDGSAESLRGMPLSVLSTVTGQAQSWRDIKRDSSTIEEKFHKMGIMDLYDLLMHAPDRYIDRSSPQPLGDLIEGEDAVIVGRIVEFRDPSPKVFVIVMEDTHGERVELSFFNQARWLRNKYKIGDDIIATGLYKPWHSPNGWTVKPQLSQPQIDLVASAGALPIMPVYDGSRKYGLSSPVIMHAQQELVDRLGDRFHGPAWAQGILDALHTDVQYGQALRVMHQPRDTKALDDVVDGLALIELVMLMVLLQDAQHGDGEHPGVSNASDGALTDAYRSSLPYVLTGAQNRALGEIMEQMDSPSRLHALLVGDVGSGKTTVMHMAALKSVDAGHQAVILAPTEILARQLYDVFMGLYEKMPEDARNRIHPVYHAGYKGKGSTKRRNENIRAMRDGTANLIFGTHSVLNVEYHDLGFVGVDEQHKFGAKQRSALLDIRSDGHVPDLLMQTATPIPRSMAQIYYGDLTFLELNELPAGRQPIVTEWVKVKGEELLRRDNDPVWSDIINEAGKGHGTFIVCPMVEDTPKLAASSVKKTLDKARELLPGLSVEAVYGSQDKKEQDRIIEEFRDGTVDVLVASSVVEVGVSCEQATRMVIMDANRFGLASLHQIRGRVGRSNLPSKCYLIASPFAVTAQSRLKAMTETLDGWELSKTDLANRGSGSLFGTSQSGGSDMHFMSLSKHERFIKPAKTMAAALLKSKNGPTIVQDAGKYFGNRDILS